MSCLPAMITAFILLIIVFSCFFFFIDPLRNLKQTTIEYYNNATHTSFSFSLLFSSLFLISAHSIISFLIRLLLNSKYAPVESSFRLMSITIERRREFVGWWLVRFIFLLFLFRIDIVIFCFRYRLNNDECEYVQK